MGLRVDIVPATDEHAKELAADMRPSDLAELAALGIHTSDEGIRRSLAYSVESYALLFGDEVAAIFGVAHAKALRGSGMVWLLSGRAVEKHPLAFLRLSKPVLSALRKRWPQLYSFTDARYGKALSWAEWMGFSIGGPVRIFGGDFPFRPIAIGGD